MSRTGKISTSEGTEGDHPRWHAHQVSFQPKYSFLAIGTAALSRMGPGAIMCDVFSAIYMRTIVPRRFNWPSNTLAVILCVFLSYMLFSTDPVHALDPNKRLTQYMHTSWRTQDGSAPSGMYTITQTSDGFLWFLSSRGDIYRFDGVQFRLWRLPADAASIGRIRNMVGDKLGGLWVLGASGIAYLKGGNVIARFELEGLMPNASNLSQDADGSLWVVRGENGISEPVCHVAQSAIKCFGKADGIPDSPIDAIVEDGRAGFWLGGQAALIHWHAGVSEMYPIAGLRSNAGAPGIISLARGPDGSVWVGIISKGQGQGLARFDHGSVRSFVTQTFDGSKFGVFALHFDRGGNLWVGSDNDGIFRVHGNAVDHYAKTEGLSSDFVRTLFEDREGIVWAATSNGADKFHDPRITTFSAVEGLAKDWAVGVSASGDGTIWVANAESLDHIEKNGAISSIQAGKGLPGSQVSSLLEDHAGNAWVGVDDGLYVFKNGHFRRLPEPNHRPLGLVFELIEDVDGNIWAECATGNLVRIRNFQVQQEFSRSQIPTGRLAPDPQGGIWIGTRTGDFLLFRDGVLKKFPVGSKANPWTNQIIAEADGSVVAAFDDGLVGLRQGKVQRMTTKNGLPCDGIFSFIEDKEKRWWLNTQCGIVEFSDSELQRWWASPGTTIQVRFYDVLDGARPSTRPPFKSAATSSDGRVWFVNSGVVQMVDLSSLAEKGLPAETYIQSVVADRKEFAATDKLKLSPRLRDLQIDYTSPTFLVPQKVRFRYRLDDYDRDWHEAGTRRQAFYTDLPPGKYMFRVTAANSDGVWSETSAKLDFSVAPAYYQANWFRALCATVFLALLWAAYQFRVRQLHHQFDVTLEARVSERSRIARELHDTLLQSFHGLLLRFQTVFQLLPGRPMEAKEKLGSAIEQAAAAITEGRDAVQGLRDSTVQGNDLALAISALGEELATDSAKHRSVAFRVAVEGEARNLHPILRDDVYKIAAEALRNAFRHAKARMVEAEIRYDNEQFRLRVRDDGKGIDPAILSSQGSEGHYGLPGLRERATLIGGKLVVWSEVDAGTEVELCVPASTAYATAQRSSWFSRKASTSSRSS
jgi:signal transduction histidine kinase/ligand-binding sensor domain-containing protein